MREGINKKYLYLPLDKYISNPSDNYLLRQEDYQNKLIALITDAIEKYYQKD